MKAFKRIVISLVALLVIFIIGGLFLPATTHVERNIVISASSEQIFPWLNEMDRFNEWSPWVETDPDAQYELEGPTAGVGAVMRWKGDASGEGSQEIIESVENQSVQVKLDFGSQGTAVSYYQLNDEDNGTRVTWGFDSDHGSNILHRYFGLFLDKWVGADYEKGLINLKQLVELTALQEQSAFGETELIIEGGESEEAMEVESR